MIWTAPEVTRVGGSLNATESELLHMIREYARHNGHADMVRQGVDGVTGA